MNRALFILSLGTVIVTSLAIIGQILTFTMGITFDAHGSLINPTPQAEVVYLITPIGENLALPGCLASFVVGLVAIGVVIWLRRAICYIQVPVRLQSSTTRVKPEEFSNQMYPCWKLERRPPVIAYSLEVGNPRTLAGPPRATYAW
jgi:hypothetical protein